MGKYGEVAVKAAKDVNEGMDPKTAWDQASCEIFERGRSSQVKGCPKAAFMSFFGGKGDNASYALAGLTYLKSNPDVNITADQLWAIIMDGRKKAHNGQMDVVLFMFKEGLL